MGTYNQRKKKEAIRFSTYILSVYIILLPIATALAGIIGETSLLNYIAILYVLVVVIEDIRHRYLIVNSKQWAIYAFMAYALLSGVWSLNISFNYYFITFLVSFAILVLTTTRRYYEREIVLINKAFLLSSITIIGATLLNINNTYAGRIVIKITSEMDPNDFGCGACIVFTALLMNYNKSKKILPIIALLGISAAVILTGSRGALLMCIVEVIGWIALFLKKGKGKTILLIVLFVIALYLANSSLSNELLNRFSVENLLSSGGSGRSKIWAAGIDKFVTSDPFHMFFGYGHGSFAKTVGYYGGGRTYPYEAHNIFINAIIESGILGTFLLVLAFIQCLKCSKSNNNYIGYISLIGLIVVGLTLDVQSYRLFPMVFFVAIVFSNTRLLYNNCVRSKEDESI